MNLHTVKFENVIVRQYRHSRHFNVPLRGTNQVKHNSPKHLLPLVLQLKPFMKYPTVTYKTSLNRWENCRNNWCTIFK